MKTNNYDRALDKFRAVLANAESNQEIREIIESRNLVLARYQNVFSLENLPKINEETFRSFLYFENNRHWSGLYRHASALCSNMGLLRNTLQLLLPGEAMISTGGIHNDHRGGGERVSGWWDFSTGQTADKRVKSL